MSEAIKGNGIRAYLEQPSGGRTLGTATWTGAGYTVQWDDGFVDVKGTVYHFGPGDFSLQLVDTDEEDDNDYSERCEICDCAWDEDEEPYLDVQDIEPVLVADALNAVLYTLSEALGLVEDGDKLEVTVSAVLELALDYIAIGQEAERNA